ncbi:MAG TPA: ADYC domain-containing protein [Hyalangium sp.]|nr:ADYC domain-containing protein [Hyalangium sp.]
MGAVLLAALLLTTSTAHAEGDGYQSQQGTFRRGTGIPWLEEISPRLNTATFKGITFDAVIELGQLTAEVGGRPIRGTDFVGVRFSAAPDDPTVTFEIVRAGPHTNRYTGVESRTVWEYQVEWTSASAGPTPLCPGGAPALVLPGSWSGGDYRKHYPSAAFFFACLPYVDGPTGRLTKGGVTAKCVDWGYPPWLGQDGMPDGSTIPVQTQSEALRYHAACTAMASADFCGEGRTNTVDGTPIMMFNAKNVQIQTAPSPPYGQYIASGPFGNRGEFVFESAWTARSTIVPGVGDVWRTHALCQTKKRWSTLPLGGTCAVTEHLPDPRERNAAAYCESITASDLLAQGALLFSYSMYLDAGLYRFKHQNQPDQFITTASIVIDPALEYPASYKPNPALFTDADLYELDVDISGNGAFEGSLLKPEAMDWFPDLAATYPLLRYRHQSGRYLTIVDGMPVPWGYDSTSQDPEGYVYAAQPSTTARPIYLWQQSSSTVTSTFDMGTLGYNSLFQRGFIPQSPSDYSNW